LSIAVGCFELLAKILGGLFFNEQKITVRDFLDFGCDFARNNKLS